MPSVQRWPLAEVVARLRAHYGSPQRPNVTSALHVILFENVAYLVDDDRRRAVWAALKRRVGIDPRAILKTPESRLTDVIRDGGMQPSRRAEKLRTTARLVIDDFEGDLDAVLKLPEQQARRALRKFPGIGEPGADKILMLTRTRQILALESNGLRCLVRLGFGEDAANYANAYRSVQQAIANEIDPNFDWLIAAHQLLRQHGQVLCKRSAPECNACPLARRCAFVHRENVHPPR